MSKRFVQLVLRTSLLASGKYVHAMMQLGSGSWDRLFTLNYMRAW